MEVYTGPFVTDFLGDNNIQMSQQHPVETIAIARENSRQIVGNIINNYYSGLPGHARLDLEWRKVQEWLIPSHMQQAPETQAQLHRDSRASHVRGTCDWYTSSDMFKEWLQGPRQLEWIHGSGKFS